MRLISIWFDGLLKLRLCFVVSLIYGDPRVNRSEQDPAGTGDIGK